MANRNVNKVILIGNLTRDPELRYTPQGTAVANFTVATNRSWSVEGVQKEAVDFHSIVAWNKLAELCSQLLTKGTMVYVEGRLQTRSWDSDEGRKYKTEVNIDEMIILKQSRGSDDDDSVPVVSDTSDNSDFDTSSTPSTGGDEVDIDKILAEIDEENGGSE